MFVVLIKSRVEIGTLEKISQIFFLLDGYMTSLELFCGNLESVQK